MTTRQAWLLGLLAAIWGGSYLLIKYALDGFSPAEVVFLRTAEDEGTTYAWEHYPLQFGNDSPLSAISTGDRLQEVFGQDYAFLEREDILAAVTYAARQTDHIVLQHT